MKLDPRTLADSQLDMLSRGYGATKHQSVTLCDGPWHIMQGRVSKTGDATKGTLPLLPQRDRWVELDSSRLALEVPGPWRGDSSHSLTGPPWHARRKTLSPGVGSLSLPYFW